MPRPKKKQINLTKKSMLYLMKEINKELVKQKNWDSTYRTAPQFQKYCLENGRQPQKPPNGPGNSGSLKTPNRYQYFLAHFWLQQKSKSRVNSVLQVFPSFLCFNF